MRAPAAMLVVLAGCAAHAAAPATPPAVVRARPAAAAPAPAPAPPPIRVEAVCDPAPRAGARVRGCVVDDRTGQRLVGATVAVLTREAGPRAEISDERGEFWIDTDLEATPLELYYDGAHLAVDVRPASAAAPVVFRVDVAAIDAQPVVLDDRARCCSCVGDSSQTRGITIDQDYEKPPARPAGGASPR